MDKELELMNIAKTEGFDRYDDVFYHIQPDQLSHWTQVEHTYLFTCANDVQLKVNFLSETIIRFRYALNSQSFESDFSYVLSFSKTLASPQITVTEEITHIALSSSQLICLIDKSDLRIRIIDRTTNQIINEDGAPVIIRSTIMKGTEKVQVTKKAQREEHYFGLGDKSCDLDLNGQLLENWNTDAFGFEADTDPLYRSIPFYYGLNNGLAYGIFFHNTHRSYFDFNSNKNYNTSFWAEGGAIDYFFMHGPKLEEVTKKYHQITGLAELPPLWSLGFHQCRWSYYPENRVREIAAEFRARKIPCDAIYLDIDYMDGYRCFTWNEAYFPNPADMINDLAEQGFQTVVMIDPGIKSDDSYWVYQDGLEKNVFCKRSSGELMIGPVWPQECVFPDFTNPKARSWWEELYRGLYQDCGVSGFWNDMNEPAVFKVNRLTFPDEVVHNYEGQLADHKRVHNIYGMLMSRSTFEGLKKIKPSKRPFVLTRATFSGGHRYAAFWTGDNLATWEHLRLANIQCQRSSISGYSLVGTDIGGFAETPDGELFLRWVQLGLFHPVFRVHSMGNHEGGAELVDEEKVKASEDTNRLDQEPWSFGEPYTKYVKAAIELRYRLLGYLYTAFWKYVNEGTPVIKSLSFYDQSDPICLEREQEFIFGDQILVSPILESMAKSQVVYLPQGNWYHLFSNDYFAGNQKLRLPVRLNTINAFVKAGSILPLTPIKQYTSEMVDELCELYVYYGPNLKITSQYFEDEGEGYGYREGSYLLRTFEFESSAENRISIHQQLEGRFEKANAKFRMTVVGLPFTPQSCLVNNDLSAKIEKQENGQITFEIPGDFKIIKLF